MNTYEILKELSKERKLSIRQLEMQFGYSNGYLAKWKTNTPNSDELARLADYFNVSVDYLLGRTEKPFPVNGKGEGFLRLNLSDLTPEEKEEVEKDVQDIVKIARQKIAKKREMLNRD